MTITSNYVSNYVSSKNVVTLFLSFKQVTKLMTNPSLSNAHAHDAKRVLSFTTT